MWVPPLSEEPTAEPGRIPAGDRGPLSLESPGLPVSLSESRGDDCWTAAMSCSSLVSRDKMLLYAFIQMNFHHARGEPRGERGINVPRPRIKAR